MTHVEWNFASSMRVADSTLRLKIMRLCAMEDTAVPMTDKIMFCALYYVVLLTTAPF
jgi:hypothetical protein